MLLPALGNAPTCHTFRDGHGGTALPATTFELKDTDDTGSWQPLPQMVVPDWATSWPAGPDDRSDFNVTLGGGTTAMGHRAGLSDRHRSPTVTRVGDPGFQRGPPHRFCPAMQFNGCRSTAPPGRRMDYRGVSSQGVVRSRYCGGPSVRASISSMAAVISGGIGFFSPSRAAASEVKYTT